MLQRFFVCTFQALSNWAILELNFLVSGRTSVVKSTFSVFGLSYGRSGKRIGRAFEGVASQSHHVPQQNNFSTQNNFSQNDFSQNDFSQNNFSTQNTFLTDDWHELWLRT